MAVSEELKPFLRAQVFSLLGTPTQCSPNIAVDANILMLSTYDRYDQQRLLGQRVPSDERIDPYLRYERTCRAAGTRLWVCRLGVCEFLRTVEMAELKILWARLDAAAAAGDFQGFQPKSVRVRGGTAYRELQDRVLTYAEQLLKRFRILNSPPALADAISALTAVWPKSIADVGDATLVADALADRIRHIMSDDRDLATINGIVLITANRTVIDTARAVNQLVTTLP